MGRFWVKLGIVMVALALPLAACNGEAVDEVAPPPDDDAAEDDAPDEPVDEPEEPTETLVLGSMGPMTGDYASWGTDWWNATQLAVNEINDAGGCNGYTFDTVQGDSQGDAGQGISAANDLIARGMYALIGPIFSSVTLPVSELLEDHQIPHFSGSSAIDITERGLQYTFRMAFPEDESGPFDAIQAREITGAQTAVGVHDNTAFAQGLTEEFAQAWEEDGGEILSIEVITPGEADYSSALTRIAGMDPDLVYFGGYYPEGAQLLVQGRDIGLENDQPGHGWWFGNSNQEPTFIEIAGAAAEGVLLGTWPTPETDPGMAEYADKYREASGEEPSSLGHWAYDAVYVICEAIQQAGTSDMDAVLETLKSPDFEYVGVSGPIAYDEVGNRLFPPLDVITVQDGRFTLYEG